MINSARTLNKSSTDSKSLSESKTIIDNSVRLSCLGIENGLFFTYLHITPIQKGMRNDNV